MEISVAKKTRQMERDNGKEYKSQKINSKLGRIPIIQRKLVKVSRRSLRRPIPRLPPWFISPMIRLIHRIHTVSRRRYIVRIVRAVPLCSVYGWHGGAGVLVLHVLLALGDCVLDHVARHALSHVAFLTFAGVDLAHKAARVHLWLVFVRAAGEVEER